MPKDSTLSAPPTYLTSPQIKSNFSFSLLAISSLSILTATSSFLRVNIATDSDDLKLPQRHDTARHLNEEIKKELKTEDSFKFNYVDCFS